MIKSLKFYKSDDMKNFSKPEMMVHTALCTNKQPQSVLVYSNDTLVEDELKRHRDIKHTLNTTANILDNIRDIADNSIDVLLLDTVSSDAALFAHINRVLKDDGLLVCDHPHLDEFEANKSLMEILGNYFKIIMPYKVGGGKTMLLCSKEYHPTADIILQRSDLLEGHSYYNCDIHTAAFAMPQYIRKQYLGIIRN